MATVIKSGATKSWRHHVTCSHCQCEYDAHWDDVHLSEDWARSKKHPSFPYVTVMSWVCRCPECCSRHFFGAEDPRVPPAEVTL